MSDIVTILVDLLIKAKEDLAKATGITEVDVAKMKVKNLEVRLDRILTMVDL
jgi:DNA-binding Xre family transcriptional regulator